VNDAEIPWTRTLGKALRRDDLTVVVVDRLVGEGPPHTLERAGVRVEHRDAVIAISVGHEQLVALRVHPDVGGTVHVRRVSIAPALVAVTDLHHELAVARELEHLIVGDAFEPGQSVGRTVVAGDPDKAPRVDVNAVFAFGPL
jgi:hypothetical protein